MSFITQNTVVKLDSAFEVSLEMRAAQLDIRIKMISKSPDPNRLGNGGMNALYLEIAKEQAGIVASTARMVNHQFHVRNGLTEGGVFNFLND